MNDVQQALDQLVLDGQQAQLLRDGLRVAIIGRPNVGKSSLLNAQRPRARHRHRPAGHHARPLGLRPGAQGVPITLVDTAGIRSTADRVEQLGIERSRAALASADAVVLLYDLSSGWSPDDSELRNEVPEGTPLLVVGNKSDLGATAVATDGLAISARSGLGLAELSSALLKLCGLSGEGQGLLLALNQRQCDLAAAAAAALELSQRAARDGLRWDFWTIDVRVSIRAR